eukprot:Sspe_Gene.30625::Locus_15137_Transcript_1_1_Confidence_1.000_Length_3242::g.30625::m.30625
MATKPGVGSELHTDQEVLLRIDALWKSLTSGGDDLPQEGLHEFLFLLCAFLDSTMLVVQAQRWVEQALTRLGHSDGRHTTHDEFRQLVITCVEEKSRDASSPLQSTGSVIVMLDFIVAVVVDCHAEFKKFFKRHSWLFVSDYPTKPAHSSTLWQMLTFGMDVDDLRSIEQEEELAIESAPVVPEEPMKTRRASDDLDRAFAPPSSSRGMRKTRSKSMSCLATLPLMKRRDTRPSTGQEGSNPPLRSPSKQAVLPPPTQSILQKKDSAKDVKGKGRKVTLLDAVEEAIEPPSPVLSCDESPLLSFDSPLTPTAPLRGTPPRGPGGVLFPSVEPKAAPRSPVSSSASPLSRLNTPQHGDGHRRTSQHSPPSVGERGKQGDSLAMKETASCSGGPHPSKSPSGDNKAAHDTKAANDTK